MKRSLGAESRRPLGGQGDVRVGQGAGVYNFQKVKGSSSLVTGAGGFILDVYHWITCLLFDV